MAQRIYIFGAHSRAQTLAVYIQHLYPDVTVEAYLYDNNEKNPDIINGVKVCRMDTDVCAGLDRKIPVFLGMRSVYHEKIKDKFRELGFEQIYPVTAELDLKLRNAYMEKYFESKGQKFQKIDHLFSGESQMPKTLAAVYVVRSVFDSPLRQDYMWKHWEKGIQAGAALSSEIFPYAVIKDDTGENISRRNRQFCELTALYWIWKHAKEEIIGLAHYRRHFILPEDWVERMTANRVDVILPVPLYVMPSIEENFKMRHDLANWDDMMECLKERSAEEYQEASTFFRTNLYVPCNMFIVRKDVLNRLCEWLFSILFCVAAQGGKKEDGYQNRYPGFLSERLITFFFEKHRNEYKIVYADKNFLS